MALMEHRRRWTVTIADRVRTVDVVYAAMFGWMSIEVDGVRVARGWREWQTVVGGATLRAHVDGRAIEARVAQPFGRQEYAFSLRLDGELLPGSDPQPEPRAVTRGTRIALLRICAAAAISGSAVAWLARGQWLALLISVAVVITVEALLERVV
jgi:hypothetical protein